MPPDIQHNNKGTRHIKPLCLVTFVLVVVIEPSATSVIITSVLAVLKSSPFDFKFRLALIDM